MHPTTVNHASRLQGGLQSLKEAVKSDKSILSLEDGDKRTIYHVAAQVGQPDSLTWLLKLSNAADLKKKDRNGSTPLHIAAQNCHMEAIELLLKKGASPNAEDRSLASPFLQFCRTLPSGTQPLPADTLNMLELFLERGADVDSQDSTGDSPLHGAAASGRVDLVRFLLSNAANPNLLNMATETPLHQAVRCKDQENSVASVRLLVDHHADTDFRGPSGTALTLAMRLPNVPAAFLLKPYQHAQPETPTGPIEAGIRLFGPSYDNLRLLSLLDIDVPQEPGPSSSGTSQMPGSDDIMSYNDGFKFELGSLVNTERALPDELPLDRNTTLFDYRNCSQDEVANMMGVYMTTASRRSSSRRPSQGMSDDSNHNKHYFNITVLKVPEYGKYRGILRTSTGDHPFFIPAAIFKSRTGPQLPGKEILKELTKEIPELDIKGISKCVLVEHVGLHNDLVNFESSKIAQSSRTKIGILYVKQGQSLEEEVFGNEYGSEEFEAFLEALGEIIELEGWQGFKGDLDVVHNRTGTHSLFTNFKDVDIMFHVSTLLPHSTEDEQQIAKKRCIGNDLTTIVFLEKGAVFKPPCVSGDFLQVFAAVQPAVTRDGTRGFRVAVSRRGEVPFFGPALPQPAFLSSESDLRDFLLTKLINGERASLNSPYIASKMSTTRNAYLKGLTKEYYPSLMRLNLTESPVNVANDPAAGLDSSSQQRASSPGNLGPPVQTSAVVTIPPKSNSLVMPGAHRSASSRILSPPNSPPDSVANGLHKDPFEWSVHECAAWLQKVDLEELVEVFVDNHVAGEELLELTDDDLKSMGITKLGQRKKLVKMIAELAGESSMASTHNNGNDSSDTTESPEESPRISIKLSFRGEWYSLKVTRATTFKSLRRQLEDQFQARLRIKFSDLDGDQLIIKRESDWQECLDEGLQRKRIKLYLSERDGFTSSSSGPIPPIEKPLTPQARSDMFGMFETILDPVIIISEGGIVQYTNKKVESVLGYTPNDLLGANVNTIMPDNVKPYHDNFLRNYLKTGVSRIIGRGRDVIALKKDGSMLPIHLEVSENSLGSGKLYFVGVLKEAVPQQVEKSLLQTEREVLDTLRVPAIIIDAVGSINGFNKAAQDFLGYSLVDVIGKNVNMLMPSPHKEEHDGYLSAYMQTGVAKIIGIGRRIVAQHRDGPLIPCFLTVTEKRDKDKTFFTGILQELQTAAARSPNSERRALK